MFRAVVVDVRLEVQPQYLSRTERAGGQAVGTEAALVLLEVLLEKRSVAVLAADGVMQATLVEVLLRYLQATVCGGAFDRRVLAVQHDVVVDVDALGDPVAACLGVRALDDKLIQHRLDNPGHRANVTVALNSMPARGTGPLMLWRPCVIETLAAEVVVAGELDGLVEGGVADEAGEVAVGRGDVF